MPEGPEGHAAARTALWGVALPGVSRRLHRHRGHAWRARRATPAMVAGAGERARQPVGVCPGPAASATPAEAALDLASGGGTVADTGPSESDPVSARPGEVTMESPAIPDLTGTRRSTIGSRPAATGGGLRSSSVPPCGSPRAPDRRRAPKARPRRLCHRRASGLTDRHRDSYGDAGSDNGRSWSSRRSSNNDVHLICDALPRSRGGPWRWPGKPASLRHSRPQRWAGWR